MMNVGFEFETNNKTIEKRAYCQYDPTVDFERSVGGLRIFLPTAVGYINYNIVHSVHEGKNCDMWRLGKAFARDDELMNEYELTPKGAEWDMALRIEGRKDFIGGYAHGDEIFNSITVKVDGRAVEMESLVELTPFEKIVITVGSVGYDPDDSVTEAIKHFKEYVIDKKGIELNPRVEWLGEYSLVSCFMAMMPPLKTLTESFYTNVDETPKEAITNYGTVLKATEAVVYGPSLRYTMSIPRYPSLPGGDRFSMTDNRGCAYNKMYFRVCHGNTVSKGDVWESTTKYSITNGEA